MKSLTVHSLPIDEVMKDLAAEFNTDYICKCDEYYIEIPKEYGQGIIYGIMFDTGIGMINYEVEFNEDVEIKFVKDNVHPIKYIFCYQGHLSHFFPLNKERPNKIDTFQNAIVASKDSLGHILLFPENVLVKINSIEINRRDFIQKFNCPISELPIEMQTLFTDIHSKKDFSYIGQYSLSISNIILNIKNFQGNNFLRRIYLEAKGYELLTLQLAQFMDDNRDENAKELLRRSEVQTLENAAKFLQQNITKYITIKDLSSHVGLNENKLQVGFQLLYGKTINNFVQDYRLEEASRLLLLPDYNISEVAAMIGINSKSYFSKIFKEKYNVTPKAFQRRYLGRE